MGAWFRFCALLAGGLIVAACTKAPEAAKADTIYFGGPILTMEGEAPQYAEALVVKDGKILFVGGLAEADKLADLVVLDKDPTRVEPSSIGDIRVLETIKEGRTVYQSP